MAVKKISDAVLNAILSAAGQRIASLNLRYVVGKACAWKSTRKTDTSPVSTNSFTELVQAAHIDKTGTIIKARGTRGSGNYCRALVNLFPCKNTAGEKFDVLVDYLLTRLFPGGIEMSASVAAHALFENVEVPDTLAEVLKAEVGPKRASEVLTVLSMAATPAFERALVARFGKQAALVCAFTKAHSQFCESITELTANKVSSKATTIIEL